MPSRQSDRWMHFGDIVIRSLQPAEETLPSPRLPARHTDCPLFSFGQSIKREGL